MRIQHSESGEILMALPSLGRHQRSICSAPDILHQNKQVNLPTKSIPGGPGIQCKKWKLEGG
eukprot:15328526-Ditylum_brightwellii.AAC.2